MKVSNLNQMSQQINGYLNKTQGIQPAQRQNGNQAQTGGDQSIVSDRDRVNISSGSRMLQNVNNVKTASATERAETVHAVGGQVQTGTYKVDSEKVASAMMKDLIKNLG